MSPVVQPAYRWNAAAGQYVRANGRFVARSEIRGAIDVVLERERRNVRDLAAGLRGGDISLEAWRQSMRETIKNVHLYDAAAAKGGWAQLTQADYGRVGAIVKSEYQYLERFARDISSGRVALDGTFMNRAQMYAEAGRDTFHQVERAAMTEAGFRWERNILHPADHCAGCLRETARRWVRIGQLVAIGRRDCLRRCRCTLDYAKTKPKG